MTKPKIFIAGHNGMVGSALVRLIEKQEFEINCKLLINLELNNSSEFKNKLSDFKTAKINELGIY